MSEFKRENPLETRMDEAKRIRTKYSDRVPCIVEKESTSKLPPIDKKKFLVPCDLQVAQFNMIIRKRMTLPQEQTLNFFVARKNLITGETLMKEVYDKYKDEDGFLYIQYSELNVFG